jgi:LemA protein
MTTTRRLAAQLVLLGFIALPLSGCSYNKFVGQKKRSRRSGLAQNQLQRRNDLIPNPVETVKGYASHEESVFKDTQTASRLERSHRRNDCRACQTNALGRLLVSS